MEIQYKRNMGHSYIILHEPEAEQTENYQIHIFTENDIDGLLSGKIQRLNGEAFFYYDITGRQSLKNLFENRKLKRNDLEELFLSLAKALEKTEEYLLDRDRLFLLPGNIYRNMEKGGYEFLWFPFSEETMEEGALALTEYLLPKLDYEDKGGTALGYGIYQAAAEGTISADILKKQIYSEKEQEDLKEDREETEEDQEKEMQRQRILDDFYKEEPEEEKPPYSLFFGIGGPLLAGIGIFFLYRNRILGGKVLLGAAFTAVFLLAVGSCLIYVFRKKEEDKKEASFGKEPGMSIYEEEKPDPSKRDEEEENDRFGRTVCLSEKEKGNPYLLGLEGNLGAVYELDKKTVLIGKRKDSVDIYLDAPTVSRVHAQIVREEGKDYLIDLNSRNGTFLGGEILNPQEKYLLRDNALILFAQEKFRYFSGNFRDEKI